MAHQVYVPQINARAIPIESIQHIIDRIIKEVRPYSVVPDEGIAATVWLTLNVIQEGITGDLVECGVWRGGTSMAMLLAQRYAYGEIRRPVWMYDSFEGMAEPSEKDGTNARKWRDMSKSGEIDPYGQNWCAASVDEVMDALTKLGVSNHAIIRKGWYEDTLGKDIPKPSQIALLRVDCDWYDPCKLVYNTLIPRVPVGGVIMMDDYYVWDGCTIATHEYLAENSLAWPIRSVQNFHGAYMVKRGTTKGK